MNGDEFVIVTKDSLFLGLPNSGKSTLLETMILEQLNYLLDNFSRITAKDYIPPMKIFLDQIRASAGSQHM